MKLYKQYLAERDGATVHYNNYGFITYSLIPGGECYFSEIFVVPEKRNTRAAWHFWIHVQRAAALAKCSYITGSIDTNTINWKLSESLMLRLGFVVERTFGSMRYFRKNL